MPHMMIALPLSALFFGAGGTTDPHGCIPSAGYTWCAAKSACVRIWELETEAEREACAPPDDIPDAELESCKDGTNGCCWQPKTRGGALGGTPVFDTTYDLRALALPAGQYYKANSSALYHNETANEDYSYLFNICAPGGVPKSAVMMSPACQKYPPKVTEVSVWQIGQPGVCPRHFEERWCHGVDEASHQTVDLDCLCMAKSVESAVQGKCHNTGLPESFSPQPLLHPSTQSMSSRVRGSAWMRVRAKVRGG